MDRWGTYPDWLAAIGTIGAVGFGIGAVRREARLRRQGDEDRRRSQADRVTTSFRPDYNNSQLFVAVENGGERAVYGVMGEVYDAVTLAPIHPLPGPFTLGPGALRNFRFGQNERRGQQDVYAYRLSFTDYDGVTWTRTPDHRLTRDVPKVAPWWHWRR